MKKLLLISLVFLFCVPMIINAQYYYNRAFNFTGATGDYAVTDPGTNLNITGSFSLETWVNPVNVTSPSAQIIIQKRLGSAASGYTIYLSTGKVVVRTNGTSRLTGNTTIPNGVWSHIAATYNSSTNVFTVYVNGVADGTITTASAAPAPDTDSLRFAAGFNSPFAGMMDEIRIWNVERTATDLQSTMRLPLGESTVAYAGLVAAWRCNKVNAGSGMEEINGYNAYLRGTASYADLTNKVNSYLAYNTGLLCTGASGAYVSIPNAPVLSPTTALTLESWLYSPTTDVMVIISKGSSTTGYEYRMLKSSGNSFRVLLNSGVLIGSGNFGGLIPTNQWVHLAFTYNSSSGDYAYYMNGVPTQTGNQSLSLVTNTEAVTFGGGPNQAILSGMLDEVRIANYAKTADAVLKGMFTSVDTNNIPGSVCAYNFEGTLADYTNNGPRGVFNGTSGIQFTQVYNNSAEFPAPINRWDAGNFANGFKVKYSGLPFGASPTTIIDSIYFNQSLTVSDVNVFVGINHTAANDISVSLINPAGITTRILYPGGGTNLGMNMITIFDDQADSTIGGTLRAPWSPRVKPTNALSVFNSQNAIGWWKLSVTDISPASDNGILLGWGIQFNNQIITGVGGVANVVPGKFNLQQNYPNPFNPKTTINYEVAKNVFVKIAVYDILGREVKSLVNEIQKAGSYSVIMDASNLASGTYYYRMEAGDYLNTKKMIIVK